MAKHSIETVREQIIALREKDTVYKAEVDDLKWGLDRAFEDGTDTVTKTKFLDVSKEKTPVSDTELYYARPYVMQHWYGKKFSSLLAGAAESEFKDGLVSHRNRWKPLLDAYLELKVRQVPGRRPAPPKNVIGTRTQLRATCPCCFRDQAVNGDRMVPHGYTLEHGFFNGTCAGHGKPHFGTVEGRDYCADFANELNKTAPHMLEDAEKIRDGKADEWVTDYRYRPVKNPKQVDRDSCAWRVESNARSQLAYAKTLEDRVAQWKLTPPREVEVEITE